MQKENENSYIYGGWWPVWWTGTYSMILSKASFFHMKYLRLYTNEMPTSIMEYVKRNRYTPFQITCNFTTHFSFTIY